MGVGNALSTAIKPGTTMLLDTNVLIAYLADGQAISRAAKVLVDDWMHAGRNQAIVSMISVMELLVGPSRAGYDDSPYREFLNFYPHLTLHEVTFEIARTAAQIRAKTNARTPDSLIIATGIIAKADYLVTNDSAWTTYAENVLLLSEFDT